MKKLLLVLPFLVLISCGIQKRKYQSGYHVNWLKTKSQHEKKSAVAGIKGDSNPKAQTQPAPKTSPGEVLAVPVEQEILASNAKNFTPSAEQTKKYLINDPCDELVFFDGTELKVKIIEINETEVRYKKCDMPDGPIYVARKNKLFMVRYANGTKEVFKNNESRTTNSGSEHKNYSGPKKFHPLAILSLIFGILSFNPIIPIVFSILAISLGKSAIQKIRNDPDQYKGLDMATTGRILGIITLSIWLLAVILLLGILIGFFILAI